MNAQRRSIHTFRFYELCSVIPEWKKKEYYRAHLVALVCNSLTCSFIFGARERALSLVFVNLVFTTIFFRSTLPVDYLLLLPV